MSNIKYEDRYYNKEIKMQFIGEYKESTQGSIERVLKASCETEEDLGKDLFDFNREQIRRLLYVFAPKTLGSSKLNITWISTYINWALDNGLTTGVNPLIGTDSDWAVQFINIYQKKFWTEPEIDKIIQKLENAQDGIIIRGLFESIRGNSNSELLNLRQKDINFSENKLRLYDNIAKKERIIDVSDKLIKLCNAALCEEEYIKSNGNPSKDLKASPVVKLAMNDHVIRLAMTRSKDDEQQTDEHVVHRRLSNLAEEMGEPNFASPLNLVYSGMIYRAFLLYQESGQLGDTEYKEIFERFGEESHQVQTRIKNEFLNLETLKNLYELS